MSYTDPLVNYGHYSFKNGGYGGSFSNFPIASYNMYLDAWKKGYDGNYTDFTESYDIQSKSDNYNGTYSYFIWSSKVVNNEFVRVSTKNTITFDLYGGGMNGEKINNPYNGKAWIESDPLVFITEKTTLVVSVNTGRYIDILSSDLEYQFNRKYAEINKIKMKFWSPIADISFFEALLAGYSTAISPFPPIPITIFNDMERQYSESKLNIISKRLYWFNNYDIILH